MATAVRCATPLRDGTKCSHPVSGAGHCAAGHPASGARLEMAVRQENVTRAAVGLDPLAIPGPPDPTDGAAALIAAEPVFTLDEPDTWKHNRFADPHGRRADDLKAEVNDEMADRMQARIDASPGLQRWIRQTWPTSDPSQVAWATTRAVIDSWATSPNNTPVGRALQQAAARKFGLPGELAPRTEAGYVDGINRRLDMAFNDDAEGWAKKAGPLLDIYVEEQYAQTQQQLEAAGVAKVMVHRGMCWAEDGVPEGFASVKDELDRRGTADTVGPVVSNPLTSWSTSRDEAEQFASVYAAAEHDGATVQTVLTTTVPRWAVWSVPTTGPGCASEQEVVVIGGSGQARGEWQHNSGGDDWVGIESYDLDEYESNVEF